MRITVVSNNWTTRRGFVAEHGLSLLIGWKGHRILFDTGQGLALPSNLSQLKRSPIDLDAIVLSHGHYDHTGSLAWLASEDAGEKIPFYVHPDALVPRMIRDENNGNGNGSRRIGAEEEDLHVMWSKTRLVSEPTELEPGLWVSGTIENRHKEEEPTAEFMTRRGGRFVRDDFKDDMALFGETKSGLVIVSGCAHAGIVAMVEQAIRVTGNKKVRAIIGGFHLVDAPDERVDWTIEQFRRLGVSILAPMHCTGMSAISRLAQSFPREIRMLGAGDFLDLR
jgi:7,8-dihydropterin-6-yl-methyl-4-(beta-D-ribofuranosyl)aminobenzene 5'-phosphate synthase